ncbi:hypothetical protein IWW55_001433, partial [Coemansia sp. RSA 2706]
MGFKQSRKLDDSPNNDRTRGPKRQRLNICSSCNQPSEPQLPKGFPPVPPGYESRWQRWADSWRSRHGDARASDQVALALENAVTAIGRLSAVEAAESPNSPGAPTLQTMESARALVDGATQQLARTTAVHESLRNPAARRVRSAFWQTMQAQQQCNQAQKTLQGALQAHLRAQQAFRSAQATLQQAVDAAIGRVNQIFNASPHSAVAASANALPATTTGVSPPQVATSGAFTQHTMSIGAGVPSATETAIRQQVVNATAARFGATTSAVSRRVMTVGTGVVPAVTANAGMSPVVAPGATLQQTVDAVAARIKTAIDTALQRTLDDVATRIEAAVG